MWPLHIYSVVVPLDLETFMRRLLELASFLEEEPPRKLQRHPHVEVETAGSSFTVSVNGRLKFKGRVCSYGETTAVEWQNAMRAVDVLVLRMQAVVMPLWVACAAANLISLVVSRPAGWAADAGTLIAIFLGGFLFWKIMLRWNLPGHRDRALAERMADFFENRCKSDQPPARPLTVSVP